jgi:hypothetical protein
MRHTVIGLFDTYTQAESARDTLVQTGFAGASMELQANPEPATAEGAAHGGLLANIERFLSSLFASAPRPEETTRYADAMRRGAVLLRVDAASESHAELARNTLTRLGAIDVRQQAGSWASQTPDSDAGRDHSVLDELGIGSGMPASGATVTRPDPYRGTAAGVDPSRATVPAADPCRAGDPLTGTPHPVDPIAEPLVDP